MIRGIVELRKLRPTPTIDRCIGVPVGNSVRVGSLVSFNGHTAVVHCINFTYSGHDTIQVPGSRQIATVNIGYPYDNISLDLINVIKY